MKVPNTTLCYGSCITEPGETYGMLICYKDGITCDSMPKVGKANLKVVSKARKAAFVDRPNAVSYRKHLTSRAIPPL